MARFSQEFHFAQLMHSSHCWDALPSPLSFQPLDCAICAYTASWDEHPRILTSLPEAGPPAGALLFSRQNRICQDYSQLNPSSERQLLGLRHQLLGRVLLWFVSCLPGFGLPRPFRFLTTPLFCHFSGSLRTLGSPLMKNTLSHTA